MGRASSSLIDPDGASFPVRDAIATAASASSWRRDSARCIATSQLCSRFRNIARRRRRIRGGPRAATGPARREVLSADIGTQWLRGPLLSNKANSEVRARPDVAGTGIPVYPAATWASPFAAVAWSSKCRAASCATGPERGYSPGIQARGGGPSGQPGSVLAFADSAQSSLILPRCPRPRRRMQP